MFKGTLSELASWAMKCHFLFQAQKADRKFSEVILTKSLLLFPLPGLGFIAIFPVAIR